MITLIKNILLPNYTQWEVIGYVESLGTHILIQRRINKKTGYVHISKSKMFVNCTITDFRYIQSKILN